MRVPYIAVDKYVATPYDPTSQGTFPPDTAYYELHLQAYEDNGNPPTQSVSIYLGDDQNRNRVNYWADDKQTNLTQDVLKGKPIATDDQGHLTVYVAVSSFGDPTYCGCIFNVFASPTPNAMSDAVNQTLTCCYSTFDEAAAVQDTDLSPLVPGVGHDGLVTIPAWHTFSYSISLTLGSLSQDVSPNAKLSIVINGKRVDNSTYTYSSLQTGVEIPYGLMIAGDGQHSNNTIVYITDDGSPKSSVPWKFPVNGVPLLMPDPTRQAAYAAPWWWGASQGKPPKTEPMTDSDLYISNDNNGFDVVVPFADNVQPGDVYRVFIYLNGYAAGAPHTQVLGDGSPVPNALTWDNILEISAPPGVKAGDTGTIAPSLATTEGFAKLDANDDGYLWVNYQVNGQDWSNAYVGNRTPIRIDFQPAGNHMTGTGDDQ